MRDCAGMCPLTIQNGRSTRVELTNLNAIDAHGKLRRERSARQFQELVREKRNPMGTPLLWIGFNAFVLIAVALDLGVFNRRLHKVELREAFWSTLAWVALSVLFGFGVWYYLGSPARGRVFHRLSDREGPQRRQSIFVSGDFSHVSRSTSDFSTGCSSGGFWARW